MKEKTITILYGTFVFLMVLALCIAYANVVTELKIEGNTVGQEQQGVYITEVEYLSNNGADTTNSGVNYFLGTMLDSNIVLGSSSSSSITYKVTIKNNTDREQVFIGIIKEETDENAYSNPSIQTNVKTAGGITGLEEYVTTIAPGEYITFPVTYAYAVTDIANFELQGKINFRFREKPILELSNNGETYTLENIGAGHEEEYEFTVSNYNETYTNGVPLTYTFETTLTEGSPLEVKIYDSEGNEVTENITMSGDGTSVDHTYTLKLIWDSNLDSTDYEGQSYTCTVKLTAIPDTTVDEDLADYAEYSIEKEFGVDITTNTAPTVTSVTASNIKPTTATITAVGSDSDGDTITYTLEINGKTYTSTTGTFSVTGLSPHTEYNYKVEVTDGIAKNIAAGSLTTTNTAPTISRVSSSNITATTATVTAVGADEDGEKLTYTLLINEEIYTSTTGVFNLTGLSQYTDYSYIVTVTDGVENATKIGEFKTLCDHSYTVHSPGFTWDNGWVVSLDNHYHSCACGSNFLKLNSSVGGMYSIVEGKCGLCSGSSFGCLGFADTAEHTTICYYYACADCAALTVYSSDYETVGTIYQFEKTEVELSLEANYDYKGGKTTNQFTIGMMSKCTAGKTLTYTLYYSTSQNGSYSVGGTTTGSNGNYKYITVTGLKEYTTYWWYIVVTDGTDTVTSSKQSLKTYCSGTGSTTTCSAMTACSGSVICSTCGGNYSWPTGVCGNTVATTISSGGYVNCSYCGTFTACSHVYAYCYACGSGNLVINSYVCSSCSAPSSVSCNGTIYGTCSSCYQGYMSCTTHAGYYGTHYYCTTHNVVNYSSTHTSTTCSHGKTSQHDS